jgi:hypothetical protein
MSVVIVRIGQMMSRSPFGHARSSEIGHVQERGIRNARGVGTRGGRNARGSERGGRNAGFGTRSRPAGSDPGPRTKVPQTGSPVLGYSSLRHRSAATAPVERVDKRTLPVRRPDHHTAPAPLSACRAENTRDAAQAQAACGAPESTKKHTNDVSHCDRVVRRSRQFHAAAAPSRHHRPVGRPSVLSNERLPKLPRDRPRDGDRHLPRLRLDTASARAGARSLTPIP